MTLTMGIRTFLLESIEYTRKILVFLDFWHVTYLQLFFGEIHGFFKLRTELIVNVGCDF
jgi:hypothetical protein